MANNVFFESVVPQRTELQINANLEMQTCTDRLVMGGQMDSQIDASKKQVSAERFQRYLVLAHAKENNAETDLHWLAKQ